MNDGGSAASGDRPVPDSTSHKREKRTSSFRGLAFRVGRLIAIGYIAVLALLYFRQRAMIYLPHTDRPPVPRAEIEEIEVDTDDGLRLTGWYWPGERPLTVVIFHGNAGHRGHRYEWMRLLKRLLDDPGVAVLDYRGFGGNPGSPTEEGLYLDAEAFLAALKARSASPRIYLGESLGSGVAVEMARRDPPAALILQAAYSSLPDVASRHYPFVPARWLLKDRFESVTKIPEIRVPKLHVHGARDRIIPIDSGRALFHAAAEPKIWLEIDTRGHNDLVGGEYDRGLVEFVDGLDLPAHDADAVGDALAE